MSDVTIFDLNGELRLQGTQVGGGPPKGSVLPTAAPVGATVDDTTYFNPVAFTGTLTTLVLPIYDAPFAVAVLGDAYPRIIFDASGIFLGNGTFDPYLAPVACINLNFVAIPTVKGPMGSQITLEPDGTINISANQTDFPLCTINMGDANIINRDKGLITIPTGVQPGFSGTASAAISSGAGAPAIGGEVNDLYIRADAPDVNNYLYRCTVANVAGMATWVAIGGLA